MRNPCIGDATHRMTQLLATWPDGAELGVFLPKIAEAGADRPLHCRAALAATLVAALELSRNGALTLQQEAPWHAIRVQRHNGGAGDTPPGPNVEG